MTSNAGPRRSLETRKGTYVDSVTLMQVSKRVGALPGVRSALVAMATDLNLDLAVGMGFEPPAGVSPNEMIVALEADGDEALDSARAERLIRQRNNYRAALYDNGADMCDRSANKAVSNLYRHTLTDQSPDGLRAWTRRFVSVPRDPRLGYCL